jgi:ABC-type multidrug transport system ATPase subunit
MIAVENLVKIYGRLRSMASPLNVEPGEIHGFLGPNG